MFARLTSLKFSEGKSEEAKRIYQQEIMPVLKQQKGNVNVMLLEPDNPTEEFISLTLWQSKEDADTYDSSGKYKELVGKVKHLLSGQTTLKSYKAAE